MRSNRRKFLKKLGFGTFGLTLGLNNLTRKNQLDEKTSNEGIKLDANKIVADFDAFWGSLKFHPTEYLTTEWGKDLIKLLHESGVAQQYVRLYNQPEDAVIGESGGKIRYNWDHFDDRAELLISHGLKPIVAFFSIPREIAADPEMGNKRPFLEGKFYSNSPPIDYKLWQDLCTDFTKHVLEKFGEREVNQWYFVCWNEPNNGRFWHNSDLEEYYKLYDHFAAGIKNVSESILIGGPALTSGGITRDPDPFRQFLRHVTMGENTATGGTGSPIDFLQIHTYGGNNAAGSAEYPHPSVDYIIEKQMILANIRNEFPSLLDKPMFVGEWGVTAGGARGMDEEPMAVVRNTQYAPAFLATLVTRMLHLKTSEVDPLIEGLALCISGYEVQRKQDFEGKRTLHTLNGFHKPLLNGYRILAKMGRELIFAGEDPKNSNLSYIVTKDKNKRLIILATNFQANAINNEGQDGKVHLEVLSPWPLETKVELKHWRIDETHSNGYTAFLKENSPINPTMDQRKSIEKRMKLEMLKEPVQIDTEEVFVMNFDLPCNGTSLIEIERI